VLERDDVTEPSNEERQPTQSRPPYPRQWDGVVRRSHSDWMGGVVEEFVMLQRTLRPSAHAHAAAEAANADPHGNADAHASSDAPLAYTGCRELTEEEDAEGGDSAHEDGPAEAEGQAPSRRKARQQQTAGESR
jgi:hypothetical protein